MTNSNSSLARNLQTSRNKIKYALRVLKLKRPAELNPRLKRGPFKKPRLKKVRVPRLKIIRVKVSRPAIVKINPPKLSMPIRSVERLYRRQAKESKPKFSGIAPVKNIKVVVNSRTTVFTDDPAKIPGILLRYGNPLIK